MADAQINTRFKFITDTKAFQKINNSARKMQTNLGRVDKQAQKTQKGIGRLGGGMVSASFQFAFAAAITGAAFQQIRQSIESVVNDGSEGIDKMTRAILQSGVKINDNSDENIAKFAEFRDFILDMGTGKTIFSINEVADAVKEVGKAVQDPANTIPVATEALKLMTIEEVGAAEAGQGLVKIFKIYKDEISDISEITDVLVSVNQQSSITLDQLIRSFKFAAQSGKTFGLSLSETGAFLGVLNEQVGTAGGGPGRAFRALLSELTNSSTLLSKELRRLDINLVNQDGSFRDLVDIAREYRTALGEAGNNDVLKAQILELADAGRQGQAALLALVNTTDTDLQNALRGAKVRGLADSLNDAFGKTPQASIKKMKNVIDGLKVAFVIGLTPAINAMSAALQEIIRDPEVQQFFVDLGKVMSEEIMPVVKFLTGAIKGLIKIFGKSKGALAALVKVFIAFAASLLIVSVLAGVAALVVIVSKAFGGLAVAVGLTNLGLLRLFGVAILTLAAIFLLKNAMDEMTKGLDEMDAGVVASNAGFGILAATVAGFAVGGPLGALVGAVIAAGLTLGAFLAQLTIDFIDGLKEADEAAQALGFNNAFEKGLSDLGEMLGLNFDNLIIGLRDISAEVEIFFSKLFDPDLDAFDFIDDLLDKMFQDLTSSIGKLGAIGATIANNIIFAITESIKNFTGFIDELAQLWANGDWGAIPAAIWQAIVDFFTGKTLFDALGFGQESFGGFGGARDGNASGDIIKGIQDFFGGDSELQKNVKMLDQQIVESTTQQQLYEEILGTGSTNLNDWAEVFPDATENLQELSETVETLTLTQNEKINAEQVNITKIEDNITEMQKLNENLPTVGHWMDNVRTALKALFDAINSLTSKVRNTRIKIEKNDEGQVIGAKLVGEAAGDLGRLRTSFATGGIVKKSMTATVGDVPGGEAIIPLSKLPGIIQQSLKGAGTGGDITINASISIDNSGGRLSAKEITDQVIEGLASKLPKKIFLNNTT